MVLEVVVQILRIIDNPAGLDGHGVVDSKSEATESHVVLEVVAHFEVFDDFDIWREEKEDGSNFYRHFIQYTTTTIQ